MDVSDALGVGALVAVLTVVTALIIGPSIWGLIDVSRTPDAAWHSIGRKKGNWIVAFAIGIWAWFVGWPAAILYLRNVRPKLKEAMAQASLPSRGTARSNRVLIGVGILLAALWIFGMWAYLTHDHEEFFDSDLAPRANSLCVDAQDELAALPSLPDSPTFEERARSVERTSRIFEGLVTDLRTLAPPGDNSSYDQWIEDWHEFVQVGVDYADAIRTGDPGVFEPAGNAGDEPATAINDVARANDMPACVF